MRQSLLYVGSYASSDRPGIYAFAFDPVTGGLAELASCSGIINPSFLAVHPNQRWLYAVSETHHQHDGVPGAVWALHSAAELWSLTPINQQASGGDYPCHVVIDATGRWLVVSNYGTGSVGVLPILADGSLGELVDRVQHRGHGWHSTRQEAPHAHAAVFAPDQRFVIVTDLGTDAVLVYAFDAATGRLAAHTHASTQLGAGPRHLTFHPSGTVLYVANELDNTVVVYTYDAARGMLQERQIVATLPLGAPESTVADIHITPAGDRLYVSNRGHDSIAVFDVDTPGQLEPVAVQPCGGRCPRTFALAPDSRHLAVANQQSDEVVVFPIIVAGATALGAPLSRTAIPGASCVQWMLVSADRRG